VMASRAWSQSSPGARSVSRKREVPRSGMRRGGDDHQGQGPSWEWRGSVRARGRRQSRALVGRKPCGCGEPTPGGCPRYRQAGSGPPLRALWDRSCSLRASAAGPSNGASHCLAGQDHRQGRSLRSRRCAMAQAPPLEQ
jgi:hypothetical protein